MNTRNVLFQIFLSIAACNLLYAQQNIVFNPFLDHFLINKGTNTPSSYATTPLFSSLNYKNRIGVLSDIRDIYFDFVGCKDEKQHFGVKLYSEQETRLFTKSKIQAIYAYRISFNEHVSWTLGTQLGAANIHFSSSETSTGGSDWSPDIALATTFRIHSFELGISAHQLPQTTLQPIGYPFVLSRYADVYLSQKINTSPFLEWETGAETKFNQQYFLWSWNNKLLYKEQFGVLLRAGASKAFSGGVLVTLESVLEGLFVSASYSNYFRNDQLKVNSFSVGFIYNPTN